LHDVDRAAEHLGGLGGRKSIPDHELHDFTFIRGEAAQGADHVDLGRL